MTNVIYTLEEVAKHNTPEDCWLVINTKVYDVTSYLEDHPGGPDIVTDVAGIDATDDYMDIGHSEDADAMLIDYLIGKISGDDDDEEKDDDSVPAEKKTIKHRTSSNVSNPAASRRATAGSTSSTTSTAQQERQQKREAEYDYVKIAAGVAVSALVLTFIRRKMM